MRNNKIILSVEKVIAKSLTPLLTTTDDFLSPREFSKERFLGLFFVQNPANRALSLQNVPKIWMLGRIPPSTWCICGNEIQGMHRGLLDRLRTDRWQSKPLTPAMCDRADLVNIVSNAAILNLSEEIRKWSQFVNRDYLRLLLCS